MQAGDVPGSSRLVARQAETVSDFSVRDGNDNSSTKDVRLENPGAEGRFCSGSNCLPSGDPGFIISHMVTLGPSNPFRLSRLSVFLIRQ